MKKELYWNVSDNEFHHSNSSISQVKNMLCSKIHCQKGFNRILFSYKFGETRREGLAENAREMYRV